jgi:hypothetical protein
MAITRAQLCEELAKLHKKHAAAFAREKELKKALTSAATENFQQTIPGLGVVKVSAPKPKECTGEAPEISIDVFLAQSKKARDTLIQKGVVNMVQQWKGAYYGSVTVELFS